MTLALATTFRIAWAARPSSIHVAISSLVFAYAGSILLFVINLISTRQVVRAQHPQLKSLKPLSIAFLMLLFVIVAAIFSLVASVVLEFYSPNDTSAITLRRFGSIVYAIIAFIPIPAVGISTLARSRQNLNEKTAHSVDNSAKSSVIAKAAIVFISAILLTSGAAYRLAALWLTSTSGDIPIEGPWYLSRGSFYAFNLGIELFVVWFWLMLRVDEPFTLSRRITATAFASYVRGENGTPQLSVHDFTRALTSLQIARSMAQRQSRGPQALSRCSRFSTAPHAKRDSASSGGASDDMGDDFDEVLMYYTDEEMSETTSDCDANGSESETSWEPKDGKWALRPASGLLPCYMR